MMERGSEEKKKLHQQEEMEVRGLT